MTTGRMAIFDAALFILLGIFYAAGVAVPIVVGLEPSRPLVFAAGFTAMLFGFDRAPEYWRRRKL